MGINLRSDREISEMRKAGLLVWQAHRIVERLIRPGITTGELDAAISRFFRKVSARPLFVGYPNSQQGKRPFPAATCISVNSEVVHGIPGGRILRAGDIVSIDTAAQLNGWCGDAAFTYAVGKIHPKLQRLLDVTQATLYLAIDLVGRKSRWSEVAQEMDDFVKSHGYSSVEDMVGHGIGREMHEEPQVPNYVGSQLTGRKDFQLRPGLVIAIEPMVNMGVKEMKVEKDDWTMTTRDHQPSAHFEHTVALTRHGPRILTAPPLPDEAEWLSWGQHHLPSPFEAAESRVEEPALAAVAG